MKKILGCLALIFVLSFLIPQKINATEVAILMTAKEDTYARDKAELLSKKVFLINKGENVMARKYGEDWYVVVKDGQQGYIEKDKIEEAEADQKLVEELNELSAETEKDVNFVNQYRKEAFRSKIWGIAIVIFILAIFGVGIYNTMKKKK